MFPLPPRTRKHTETPKHRKTHRQNGNQQVAEDAKDDQDSVTAHLEFGIRLVVRDMC